MLKFILVFAYLACAGHGRRLQLSSAQLRSSQTAEKQNALRLCRSSKRYCNEARFRSLKAVAQLFAVFSQGCAFLPFAVPGARRFAGNAAPVMLKPVCTHIRTCHRCHVVLNLDSKEDNEQLAQWLEIQFRDKLRIPGAQWQEKNRYRFIAEDDETFEEYFFNNLTNSYSCRTPEKYLGLSRSGVYERSCRLQFTLPDRDTDPKTVELLRLSTNTTCGAVRAKLPLDATVVVRNSNLVVEDITEESNAQNSNLMKGDIIRAVSLPATNEPCKDAPWWAVIGALRQVPPAEEGMVMLDDKTAAEYNAALQENIIVNGEEAEVVLLLERPSDVEADPEEEDLLGGLLSTSIDEIQEELSAGENSTGVGPAETTQHSTGENSQAHELKQSAMKTAESVKTDVKNILRVEPNWVSFTEDLQLIDPSGTRLRLPQIKDLLSIVRNFIGIFVAEEQVDIKFRFADSLEPVMFAQGTIEVRGGRLPPPLPRSFTLDVDGSCAIYFDDKGKVREVDVDSWRFNQRPLTLPKLGRGDSTNLSPQDYLELLLWTRSAIFGF